jgi:hypothetical protein
MRLGTHHTEETKAKLRGPNPRISEIMKGNTIWKGRHHSDKSKKKISNARKGMHFSDEHRRAIRAARIGKPISKDHRMKLLEANTGRHPSKDTKQKISEALKGQPFSEERCRNISKALKGVYTGERHPLWKGGVSFEPYCPKFNHEFKERVRAFWGYECGNCGKTQEENGRKLAVHHVNYRKDACCNEEVAWQFVPLCISCHTHTNHHREEWEKKLSQIIEDRYDGQCYFRQGEQLTAYGVV